MDKNYNVDDILLEIKAKKARMKSERPAVEPKNDIAPAEQPAAVDLEEFHLDFGAESDFAPKPAAAPPPRSDFMPKPDKAKPDTFHFAPPEESEPPRNPLDFNEDAFSIADKAKIRGGTMRTAREGFEFKPVSEDIPASEPPGNPLDFSENALPITEKAKTRSALNKSRDAHTTAIDFSSFRAPGATSAPRAGDTLEHTRVIPAASIGRELSTDDIRALDFGSVPQEFGEDGYYDDDYAADSIPEGSVIDYSEYNSTSDKRDVQLDIAHVKLWLFIRVAATTVLTVLLFVITFAGRYPIPLPELIFPEVPETLRNYLLTCTVLTVLIALVNSSTVGGGLIGLFKMHANSDTLAACAVLAAVGQGIVVVANPTSADPYKLNLFFCVAALAMLFNGLGKMSMMNRILANFLILSSGEPKKALLAADSDDFCREFVKDPSRRPTVVYAARAGFFTDFLGLSYSDKYDVGINRAVAPVCLIGALAIGVATFFLSGNTLSAVSAFSAVLCVCATLSATFIENVPLSKLTKKLAPQGGMVSGCKAVEDFCEVKALVLTENDLFPEGHVQLHGIKAFSRGRIDEAILDAASVLCSMDGALGPVFLDMIGGNKKLLKKVDNIIFENAMGISAWVDSRRVLIGNRRLMQNHGVTMPSELLALGQEQSEIDAGVLYLSNSGEVSAQFTVSYHIDEELAVELDQMAHREKLLVVHATDANITCEKINELYGYPIELVRIMPAEWHTRFSDMIAPREKAVAEIVYTGRASTLVKAIISCITARASILSATVIQLIQIVLGYGLVAFMAFMGSIGTVSIVQICIYQIFWFLAIFIVQKTRQS